MSLAHLPPDIIRFIALKLPLRSILNLTEVSVNFCIIIFNNIFWKNLYFRDISRFNNLNGSYPDYIRIITETQKMSPSKLLDYGSEHGYDRLVELAIQKGVDNYNFALMCAARYGHREILEILLSRSDNLNKFNIALTSAISGYQKQLINLLLELGANDFNRFMSSAAQVGDLSTVERMISLGANDFEGSLIDAAYGGNINIINLMIKYGARNLNSALIAAASHGFLSTVEELIKMGANNYNGGLRTAATKGYLEIVKYLIKVGANDIKGAIELSSIYYQSDIKYYLLKVNNP